MAGLLEIQGLTTRVSGFTILNNLDFSIEQNELRVLLGPNGAGKTTLISMITGQFRPVAGVSLQGRRRVFSTLFQRLSRRTVQSCWMAPRSLISNRTAAPGLASAMYRGVGRSFQISRLPKTFTSRYSARVAKVTRFRLSCSITFRP